MTLLYHVIIMKYFYRVVWGVGGDFLPQYSNEIFKTTQTVKKREFVKQYPIWN